MSPEMGQAWFRVAFFLASVSGVLILLLAPGTAEFVVAVTTFVIGLFFLAVVAALVSRANR